VQHGLEAWQETTTTRTINLCSHTGEMNVVMVKNLQAVGTSITNNNLPVCSITVMLQQGLQCEFCIMKHQTAVGLVAGTMVPVCQQNC